jgi:hypothetical protein
MFRCPHCAQVYKLPLSPNYSLLSDTHMQKFYVVKEPFSADNIIKAFQAMEHDAESIEDALLYVKSKEGVVYGDDYPVKCPACHEAHSRMNWVEAFEYPMEYFDAEALCGCGGEMWLDRVPRTNRYAMVCERCQWTPPKAEALSGSADATSK